MDHETPEATPSQEALETEYRMKALTDLAVMGAYKSDDEMIRSASLLAERIAVHLLKEPGKKPINLHSFIVMYGNALHQKIKAPNLKAYIEQFEPLPDQNEPAPS